MKMMEMMMIIVDVMLVVKVVLPVACKEYFTVTDHDCWFVVLGLTPL